MILKSIMLASATVLLLQVSGAAVLAQTETSNTTTATTNTEKTLEQRIAERKALLKTKLDTAAQNRLKAKCAAAQKLVTNAKTRSDKAVENRQKAYDAVQTRLGALITALEKSNIDVSTIEDLQTQVKAAVNKLKTDVATYNQTMSDLASMDCTTDPTGFKATLETARTQRQQVVKDAAALKTLKGKIVSELAKIKAVNASTNNQKTIGGGTQ